MQPDLIACIEAASEARELFLIDFHSAFPDIDDEASQQWFSLMDKLLGRIHAQDYLGALKQIATGHNDPSALALEILAKHGEAA